MKIFPASFQSLLPIGSEKVKGVCVSRAHTHVHRRGDLFCLVLLREVGRNGPQALGHGSWFLECHQGPPT